MQDKQFLKFVPTPGEKHLGIAVIRWKGAIILRYKIIPSQDGSGYWVSPGGVKTGITPEGKDKYEEWFALDSSYEKEEMRDFVLASVTPLLKQTSNQAQTTFSPQATHGTSTQAYAPQAQPQQENGQFWDAPPF